jgi:uncharacterized repeat protein (TIGR03803 family)
VRKPFANRILPLEHFKLNGSLNAGRAALPRRHGEAAASPCRGYSFHVIALALIIGFSLTVDPLPAQSIKTLHHFESGPDGRNAEGELVLGNNILYGTTVGGGSLDRGTIFSVSTDGAGFAILHDFTATADPPYTNTDGAYPQAGVILSGDTLYGTTYHGGTSVIGTVFRINIDGTGYTNLHSFTPLSDVYPSYTNSDGAYPIGGLTLSGETLYGTTSRGGTLGNGTVFAVHTDGTGFTNLHSFASSEGRNAQAALVLSGSTLYGTAYEGGSSGSGTVFKLDTNGGGFAVVHHFTAIPHYPSPYTNTDGANPVGGLILSSNTLYGTTISGGNSYGSVFAVHTDGTAFTNLYDFTADDADSHTNSGGAYPQGRLTLMGHTLYGTTRGSENFGPGTVFAIHTDGTGFTTLHRFLPGTPAPINLLINDDGSYPKSGLLLSDYTLYGAAEQGGHMGFGTVFSLSFAPHLSIVASEENVILTWPTNLAGFDYAGFILQSATNLVSPGLWPSVSPEPVVVSGSNTVTNLISDGQMFYRLSQ